MNSNTKKLIFKSDLLCNLYAYLKFFQHHKRFPNPNKSSFNDLIYKIKTKQANDALRQFVSDKEFVKLFVASTIGEKYNVPTLSVLRTKEEALKYFRDASLKNYVVKPTHLSGVCEFINDGITDTQIANIISWLDINYSHETGELFYKNLTPKIIVEPIIDFDGNYPPHDYKIFCYNGEPQMINVDMGRFDNHRRNIYTLDWKLLPFTIQKKSGDDVKRPDNLSEMLDISRTLSQQFEFIRVDLYTNGQEIHVGELTNAHGNGQEKFEPKYMDYKVGEILKDPNKCMSELLQYS